MFLLQIVRKANLLSSLSSLFLSCIAEHHVAGPDHHDSDDDGQNLNGHGGDDLPCEQDAEAAADHVTDNADNVVTGLLNEDQGVNGHQQSAGTHEHGEASAEVNAEQDAECHAGSIQTEADIHQSAEDEVSDQSSDQLAAGQADCGTSQSEGAKAECLQDQHDSGSSQEDPTW